MAAWGGKTLCSICQKASGSFTCRGCGKDFCSRHVAEHRQELSKQMDEITTNHDQLKHTMAEQDAQPLCHPLIRRVDEWEQRSINKIRQAAKDARRQLLGIIGTQRTQVTNDLVSFTAELSTARENDDYVETDLKKWTEKLDGLQADLTAADKIDFGEYDDDDDENTLIPKFFINETSSDVLGQIIGDIRISERRKVATHAPTTGTAVVICRHQYSSGQHRLRFRIEQLSKGIGFSCGIVPSNTPMNSIINPTNVAFMNMNSIIRSTTGLTNSTYCGTCPWLNYSVVPGFHEKNYQFQIDCNYEIFIDCTQATVRLTNEQLGYTNTICMSIHPFPWQFFIALYNANDRVRLY